MKNKELAQAESSLYLIFSPGFLCSSNVYRHVSGRCSHSSLLFNIFYVANKIKFLTITVGYTKLNKIINADIYKSRTQNQFYNIKNHRNRLRSHVERMPSERIPWKLLNQQPLRRNKGHLLQRRSEIITGQLALYMTGR